mgnify:FL=1
MESRGFDEVCDAVMNMDMKQKKLKEFCNLLLSCDRKKVNEWKRNNKMIEKNTFYGKEGLVSDSEVCYYFLNWEQTRMYGRLFIEENPNYDFACMIFKSGYRKKEFIKLILDI